VAEGLALSSAVVFGLVHFLSGLLARRADPWAVALYGQVGGVVLVGGSALLYPYDAVDPGQLGWGFLSGIGTGVGVAFLYRGLAVGNMSVVVPLSDVGSVALPVLVGVVLLGDRPGAVAWAGVVAAVPALWLVSRRTGTGDGTAARGSWDGLVAGVGFALQFVAISRVDPEVSLWPLLATRIAAVAVIVPLGLLRHADLVLPRRLALPAGVIGAAGSVAIVLYLLATQQQLLTLATVLAALYPAVPVVLAMAFLHERVTRAQALGLGLTGASIALITVG